MIGRRWPRGIATCLTAVLLLVWSVTSVATIMVSRPYTRAAVKTVMPGLAAGRLAAIDEVVAYAGSGGSGRLSFLTLKERNHMGDVANVFANARVAAGMLWVLAAIVSVVYLVTGRWRQVLKLLKWAVVIAEVVLAALLIVSIVDFDWLFSKFHRLFFPQGNWLFSPGSKLITLFPERFWLLSTEVLVTGTVILLAVVGAAAHYGSRRL